MRIFKTVCIKIMVCILLFSGSMAFLNTRIDASGEAKSNEDKYTQDQLEAVNHLNGIRTKAGLSKVSLNPFLAKAAENHAKYIVVNKTADTQLAAHDETEGMPDFTGNAPTDRVKSAGGGDMRVSEVISFNKMSSREAIDSWLNTAYHRSPLISPEASEIGIAMVDGTIVAEIALGNQGDSVSVYPYDGMEQVGIGFYGNETPNPLSQFNIDRSGYIISLQNSIGIEEAKATITNSRKEYIPVYSLNNLGKWFFFPAYELSYDETYTVSVDYVSHGAKNNKTWSFRTKKLDKLDTNNPNIQINGKFIPMTAAKPLIKDGSVYVPLRGIFERLNAKVQWEEATRSIKIIKQNNIVKIAIGSREANVNGEKLNLEQVPFINIGTTYVPLRFISEAFGAKVGWDHHLQTVNIEVGLGEPEDVMEAVENEHTALITPITQTLDQYGYKIIDAPPGLSIFLTQIIIDEDGNQVGDIAWPPRNITLSLQIYPNMDELRFDFIQELTEALSKTKTPGLSSTLKQSLHASLPQGEANVKPVKVNERVSYILPFEGMDSIQIMIKQN